MGDTITLELYKETRSVSSNHDTDNAVLTSGDSLAIQLSNKQGNGWPAGTTITRIDLWDDSEDYQSGDSNPNFFWASDGKSAGLTGIFSVSANTSGDTVTMEDVETVQAGSENTYFYQITMSDGSVKDPEVINKAGSGGGEWQPKTPQIEMFIKDFRTRIAAC